MQDSLTTSRGWTPWPDRVYPRLPLSTPLIGVAAVVLALGALLVGGWASGEMKVLVEAEGSMLRTRDVRAGVLTCFLVGFLPTAQVYVLRFTRSNLAALGGSGASLELAPPSWGFTAAGVLSFPLIALSIDRDPLLYFQPLYYNSATHWFQWVTGIFATVNSALLVYVTLSCARALEAAAEKHPIDLFDLSRLRPFARQGVQSALVWLLILSLFSVNAVDPGFYIPLICMVALCGGVAAIALMRCNRVIHTRIRALKDGEVARIDDVLRGDQEAPQKLSIAPTQGVLSVADLLAYRQFVSETRAWAFDSSTWIRFALVLALPVGSWVGGALVERLLDASLG